MEGGHARWHLVNGGAERRRRQPTLVDIAAARREAVVRLCTECRRHLLLRAELHCLMTARGIYSTSARADPVPGDS